MSVETVVGEPVRWLRPLSGSVFEARLASGRTVVAKRGADTIDAEVASLRWLAEVVAVPEVIGWDDEWLVIERIDTDRPSRAAAEELGRGLAALHASGAPAFGAPPPGGPTDAWIGAARMVDVPGSEWPAWYAEYRVLPYLRRSAATLGGAGVAVIERVCERIGELAGPAEPPARLHGDLWNGNVVWGKDDRPWLIDPAAHGGHRETDLAMLALFGCPHLDRIVAAYQEVTPLADGWPDRVPLHQLFPLLVHTELFGGGYAGRAVAAARAALGD